MLIEGVRYGTSGEHHSLRRYGGTVWRVRYGEGTRSVLSKPVLFQGCTLTESKRPILLLLVMGPQSHVEFL